MPGVIYGALSWEVVTINIVKGFDFQIMPNIPTLKNGSRWNVHRWESKHNILNLISILFCDNYRSREEGSHHSMSHIELDEMYYNLNLWSVFSSSGALIYTCSFRNKQCCFLTCHLSHLTSLQLLHWENDVVELNAKTANCVKINFTVQPWKFLERFYSSFHCCDSRFPVWHTYTKGRYLCTGGETEWLNGWIQKWGNTGGALSSPELPDLITTTQWRSRDLMPIPGVNLRTSTHGNTSCFSKWAQAHRCKVSNWLWNTFDQIFRLQIFEVWKKVVWLLAGQIVCVCNKWSQIICYPRSHNLKFSYLFVDFLLSGFPLVPHLFSLKAFHFLSTLEIFFFTKQVLTA